MGSEWWRIWVPVRPGRSCQMWGREPANPGTSADGVLRDSRGLELSRGKMSDSILSPV